MTIQDINCFLNLAETLNYTKTAEELFISQPAVTRHINALETELGFKLFDRSVKRKIALTDAGKSYFVIFTYLPLDKEELFVLYGDYENMLTAINSNTGSEYDIKEDFDNSPHTIYRDLLKVCLHSSFADNPKAMLVLRQSEKRRIADILQNKTGATFWQLKKFLGLE